MKLPKTVYVFVVENDGDKSNEYLAASETAAGADGLSAGENRPVGVYVLQEIRTVSLEVKVR